MARPTANPASKATGLPQCRHGLFTLFTVSLPAFLFTVFTVDRVSRVSSSPRSLGPWWIGKARARPSSPARISSLADGSGLPGAVDRGQEGKSLSRCGRSAWFRLARGFDHRPARPPRAGLLSPVAWALVDVKARARPSSPARISSLADGSGLPSAVDRG